jgi:hypothetical protein
VDDQLAVAGVGQPSTPGGGAPLLGASQVQAEQIGEHAFGQVLGKVKQGAVAGRAVHQAEPA